MQKEYWIIEDIWREIKLYLFHDIKIHGKHLKDDIYVKNFNKVVIPRKFIPVEMVGIIYQSVINPFRCAKFLYKVPAPSSKKTKSTYKLVIEYIDNLNHKQIKREYNLL
jgi:hypothetical protein